MNGLIVRTLPGGPRNGLPVRTGNYRYQGTGSDVLTAWMDDPRHRPLCGRLMPCGQTCGRRKGHKDHCKTGEAVAADRASANERSRKSRTRRQERIEQLASLELHDGGGGPVPGGLVAAREAAELLGVSVRTIERYKRDLRRSA